MFTLKISFLHLLTFGVLFGQNQSQEKFSFWGGGGLGISFLDQGKAMACLQYNIGFRYNHISLKMGNTRNDELFFGIFNSSSHQPFEFVKSQSIQLGLSFNILGNNDFTSSDNLKEVNISFYSGFSKYQSLKRGEVFDKNGFSDGYEKIEKSDNGVPIELELEWRFNNYYGITADYHLDINDFRNFFALQVNFIVGYF